MKKNNIRFSKRVYKKRICRQCDEEFIPSDARQVFCCEQHRIDYHNDQRRIKYAPFKALNLRMTKNDEILQKFYLAQQEHQKSALSINYLLMDKYDFTVPAETTISNTGNKIEWQLNYGLEGVDQQKKLYKIHKRQP